MMNSLQKILRLLGLAHRAGKVAMGRQATQDTLASGRARLLIFTTDAPQKLVEQFTEKSESVCPHVHIKATRSELGMQLGRRDVVVVAIIDSSFAQGILALLPKKRKQRRPAQ